MKTANEKIPESSVFNYSEGLYRTTICRWLVHRPHYSARGSRAPSEFFTQIRHRNTSTEIAWEDAVQGVGGNVYRSVIEKQGIVAGIVVYRQRVLQTVTSLGVVSLAFRRYDLLKIANFNPQQEARFSLWKKLFPERVAEMERRSRSQLKSAWPNVRTESK